MVESQGIIGHETRRSIYLHISMYPGVRFVVLKKIFGLKDGTLRYHLNYLEKKNMIETRLEEGQKCYFRKEVGFLEDNNIPPTEVQSDRKKEVMILNVIKRHPGITQKELCKRSNLNRFTVIYNLRKLIDRGRIRVKREGRYVEYSYVSKVEMIKEIKRRAAIDLLKGRIDEDRYIEIMNSLDGVDF